MKKIGFSELSTSLKVLTVFGWIALALFVIGVIAGIATL